MTIKRFLVPVLALAAFGLPAEATVVEYCSGSAPSCVTNGQTAFNNALITDSFTPQGLTAFSNTFIPGVVYTDSTTGIIFEDFPGAFPSTLSVTAGVLSTPHGDDSIVIVIPATYLAIGLDVAVSAGLCINYCGEGETSGFVGFINNDSPTAPWSVTISPISGNGNVQINDFNASNAGGGGGSDTPEVGTLLLIGFGLISMRWMRRWPRRIFRTPRTA